MQLQSKLTNVVWSICYIGLEFKFKHQMIPFHLMLSTVSSVNSRERGPTADGLESEEDTESQGGINMGNQARLLPSKY